MSDPEILGEEKPFIETLEVGEMPAHELHDLITKVNYSVSRERIYRYILEICPGLDWWDVERESNIPDLNNMDPILVQVKNLDSRMCPPFFLKFDPLGLVYGVVYGELSTTNDVPSYITEVVEKYELSLDQAGDRPVIEDQTVLGLALGCDAYRAVGVLEENIDHDVELRVATVPREYLADGQVRDKQLRLANILIQMPD